MTDSPKKRGAADRRKVAAGQAHEIDYLRRKFPHLSRAKILAEVRRGARPQPGRDRAASPDAAVQITGSVDPMSDLLDRAVAVAERAPPLGSAEAIVNVVKVMASIVRDLRNSAAAHEREIGQLRAALRVNAYRHIPGVTDADIDRVLQAARVG